MKNCNINSCKDTRDVEQPLAGSRVRVVSQPHSRSRTRSSDGQIQGMMQQPVVEVGTHYGWPTHWPEHFTEGDILQAAAMSAIAPNMLRSGGHIRPGIQMTQPYAIQSGGNITDGEEANGGQVKFVNATVEILQNQIRKEEAPKKKRTRTTPDQLRILQKAFTSDPMPNSSARLNLAKKLGMNARAVQVWFQNRRAKEKLETKRAEVGKHRDRSQSLQPNSYPNSGQESLLYSARSTPIGNAAATTLGLLDANNHIINASGSGNGNGDNHGLYDLGIYFGDPNLAQYSAGFDLHAYNYPLDGNAIYNDEAGSSDGSNTDVAIENASAPRFQSMPSINFNYSNMGNALGLVFDSNLEEEQSFLAKNSFQRSNSLDVLGMMGDAAAMDAQGRIFSTPASKETFLTAPLGQSVPMPTKQRSLSVPELSNQIVRLDNMFPGPDLLSIREEDAINEQPSLSIPISKRMSNSGIPTSNLIGFPGMTSLDEIQSYLDGIGHGL